MVETIPPEIHRQFGISYKSAWFMCHRVRYAMCEKTLTPLVGTIEADETYVGGKPRKSDPIKERRGVRRFRSMNVQDKAPVFGILERGGRVRAMTVSRTNSATLKPILLANIDTTKSRLMTDDNAAYRSIKRHLPHQYVNHKETYVTGGDVHVQGIENFWSLLKRGLIGTYHHVRPHYLGQYVDEFAFRYNARKMTDPERFAHALRNVDGRLTWFVGRES